MDKSMGSHAKVFETCGSAKRRSISMVRMARAEPIGMHRAFHKERPANEAVARSTRRMMAISIAASQNGQANGVDDEHQRNEDEQGNERDADVANVIRELEQAFHAAWPYLMLSAGFSSSAIFANVELPSI